MSWFKFGWDLGTIGSYFFSPPDLTPDEVERRAIEEADRQKKPDKPEVPLTKPEPPNGTPKYTVPKPKLPPAPKRPYNNPLPSPKGDPFPTIPPRKLPPLTVRTNQRSVDITSNVSFTLATRVYGCLLYEPIVTEPYKYYVCNPNNSEFDFALDQDRATKSLVAWLFQQTDILLDQLDNYPLLDALLNAVGLGDGIEAYLSDKFCDIAYLGLNILTRGAGGKVVSQTAFIIGCKAIQYFALEYANRNEAVLDNYPLIYNAYTRYTQETCDTTSPQDPLNALPRDINYDCDNEGDASAILMPDSAAFVNTGKYMVLYWVLKSNPSYKVYVTTTQLAKPIPAIWDVLDDAGKLIGSKADSVWRTYFANIERTIGYQYTRYYAEGYSKPVMSGYFKDKQDAENTFEKLIELTELEPRSKAPIIYSGSTKEDYLKELSHEGEKLILKKVVVIDKLPWKDSAKCVVTYTAKNAVQ